MMRTALKPDPQATQAYKQYYEQYYSAQQAQQRMQQEHMEQAHEAAEQAAVMAPNAEDAMPMFGCIVFFFLVTWECFEERKKKSDRAFSFVVVSIAHVKGMEMLKRIGRE